MQGELPFLVAHGDGVWTVVYALLIAGTAWLCVFIRTLLERRRARKQVHARQRANVEGDRIVLRAKLVVGEASTLAQEGFVSTHRSKELYVEHDGVRVSIVGDVVVEHGAREWTAYFRKPRHATEEMKEGAKFWSSTFLRKVGAGDDVIVTGTRGIAPSGEPPEGYRDRTTRDVSRHRAAGRR